MNTKFALHILLFIIVLCLCSNLLAALSRDYEEQEDPELATCIHQCGQQRQYSKTDKRICIQACERYHHMKKERERHMQEEEARRRKQEDEDEDEDEGRRMDNPYVFDDEDFRTKLETQEGRVRVLNKFSTRSKLLQGIRNYLLVTLEAKGHTFTSPSYFDSDAVIFVVKGRGVIGLVREDKTDRFKLEYGDMMRVPAGTLVYFVNRDENQNLVLANLFIPLLSTPPEFKAFNPEQFLTAFSIDKLEAALKTPREKLRGVFEQEEKGSIIKISREEVEAVSKVKEGFWPFTTQTGAPFNLLGTRPFISNQYGRLYQSSLDKPSDLNELNLVVSFSNITRGSMSAPSYATRATKICLVAEGEGYVEIVCPHYSGRGRKQDRPSYQRLSSGLRTGMVFVVPTGHPFLVGASKEDELHILCFELNARGNRIQALAGKNNVMIAMDKDAKQLTFMQPADKVDEIFSTQESFFFPGPNNNDHSHGRAYA
ncbi:hypothetical protein PIB30_007823 [Stylosanthes scabra]|uniref:Cupin type-1 domain-containing protein n=1 Tax=Stylosanthes scabra TaxID=79078 RepID=A0ABU6Q4N6_9FABA|nr:hypothetical protein [Stylosanthes scabra]